VTISFSNNVLHHRVSKPEGKRPLVRHRDRLDDGVGIDVKERGWELVDWIYLVQDRNQWGAVMHTFP
jgi:hypothetical protein